jgi:hypothetical protein
MKKMKIPLRVKLFKTKKYFSDKKSNLNYNLRKVKNNYNLNKCIYSIRNMISKILENLRDNKENWLDRAKADEGFIIDS